MSEEAVRAHLRAVRPQLGATDVLPPHYPSCLGCGPDAEHGYHLQVRRVGDEVVTTHVFTSAQGGGPGVAHGGAVATVVDDLLGYLLWVLEKPGVTRTLDVEYLKPVVLGRPYEVRGRVESVDGRKVRVSCTGTGPDGVLAFTGRGLFIQVPLSHFADALRSADAPPAEERADQPPINP